MTKKNLSVSGVVTYWATAETKLSKLRSACLAVDAGLDKYLPEASTPLSALRQALEQVYPGKLIRRLKGDGFAVVDEAKGDKQNDYDALGSAYFEPDGGDDSADIRFRNVPAAQAAEVRQAYSGHRGILQPVQVGTMLSRIVSDYLGGTMLRPKVGGIYWLPDDRTAKWDKIAAAVESAGVGKLASTSVYQLRHAMDENAVRAVRDAIVHEVTTEADRINEEIMGGELGARALQTREREALAMIEKVKRYEQLLDVALGGVRKSLSQVKDAAAAAAVLAAAGDDEEPAATKSRD